MRLPPPPLPSSASWPEEVGTGGGVRVWR
jgi:hypothetical protein